MEIQQHDGVVVDVAGLPQGFAELSERERCYGGKREAPGAWVRSPPFPPLYIGALGGAGPLEIQSQGGVAKGGTCPPSQVGRPPPLGFPTLGAGGGPWGAHQPTRGWFPSHFSPWGPPG